MEPIITSKEIPSGVLFSTDKSTTNHQQGSSTSSLVENPSSSYQQHALQNHVVMMRVGSYLQPKDLPSGRLVCKSWSKAMKLHQTLVLTDSNLKEFLLSSTATATATADAQQFSKYHIYDISFDDENISTLFNTFGKSMKSLKITIERITTALSLDSFRKNIVNLAPNLHELRIEDTGSHECKINFKATLQGKARFWNEGPLFTPDFPTQVLLPNLTKCKLVFYKLDQVSNCQQFLNDFMGGLGNLKDLFILMGICRGLDPNIPILNALSDKTGLDKLHELTIFNWQEAEVNKLTELSQRATNRLSLAKLKFTLSDTRGPNIRATPSPGKMTAIKQFLQTQGDSLKFLDIVIDALFKTPKPCPKLCLPPLVKLETLRLDLRFNATQIQFQAGSIVKNFPALTKLDYNNSILLGIQDERELKLEKGRWDKHMEFSAGPHPLVKDLKVNLINQPLKLYQLRVLFPNIVKLRLRFTTYELIREIWNLNKWPQQLEWLGITYETSEYDEGDFLIYEYLTGIPQKYHAKCMGNKMGNNWQQFKTKPGISDFKHLRQLKLKLGEKINDISAYCGFAHPNSKLSYLKIVDADFISPECRRDIRKQLGPQACILFL